VLSARWYTSLIGKYSSVLALVNLLRSHKVSWSLTGLQLRRVCVWRSRQIDNYFITSIKPARTQRWILAWSFGSKRVPDVGYRVLSIRLY